jgi:geranylgeranyl diphosphate synthase type II
VLALDGGQEPDTIAAFRAFATELGVLFQIVDDILDVTGSQDALGKRQGSDERLGKRTYVTEFGLDGARQLAASCHARAREALAQAAPSAGKELEQVTNFIATRTH